MARIPLRVVLTGSECTGKTTLARELAEHYGTVWVPEYAREYLDRKAKPLDAGDVEPIARGHIRAVEAAERRAGRLLILDTDLLGTVVYSRHYYGDCPAWIEDGARARRGDLYLLLRPDVAWVPDGQQRDRPAGREEVHDLFRKGVQSLGARVVDVSGAWAERKTKAKAAVDALLAASVP